MQSGIFNVGAGGARSVHTMAQLVQKRCAYVLGFEPLLQRVNGGLHEHPQVLTYKSDNLAVLGINLTSLDNTAEIDNLLRFCQSTFTQIQCPTA